MISWRKMWKDKMVIARGKGGEDGEMQVNQRVQT